MSLAIGNQPGTPSGFEGLPGVTPPSSREPQPGFLSDTIVAMGLVDQAHAEAAVAESRIRGIPPERLLVDQGHLSDEDLARARAEHAGLDYVDLENFERDHNADALIGRGAALRHHALPISIQGRALVVALADPFDTPAIGEIAALAKRDVIPVVAGAAAIDARARELPELEDASTEPPHLQPIEGGGGGRGRRATDVPHNRRATDTPRTGLPDSLTERIVEKVDATLDEVVRSEILRALDDATLEIERLSAELEQSELRGKSLEGERDELRATLGSDPASS
jgi:Type II secretion system (T2SS), protein E, N-terminal domain